MAGYSKRSLVEKLGIQEGFRIAVVNPPDDYKNTLGKLPNYARLVHEPEESLDLIHIFSRDKRDVGREIPRLKRRIFPTGALWVSWPKGSSGVKTDLNENVIREIGLKSGLVDVKVCAVDETWSALKFVYRLKDRP
jgi:predicted CoA-binding protein